MRRTAAFAAAAALLVSGCADDSERYCEALETEQKTLTELANSSAEGDDVLTPTLESFQRLRDTAPEELEAEWDTVVLAYEALVDAVEEAGIDPAEYRPEDLPDGVSDAEADRLGSVASKLASARVREAGAGIEQHATEVCGVSFAG